MDKIINRNYESRIMQKRGKGSNFHNLPKGWILVRLAEIGEIVTGTTPPKSQKDFYGNDYPFFKPTDLNNGYYVKTSDDGLSKKGSQKARLLPARSILVTCIGATIGKVGFLRTEGASNQQINAIIPEEGIYPEYIYFVCISPQFQKGIIDEASATTLPILNKTKFENLMLPLPPLAEQKRIVAKIEELFTRLEAGVEALKKVKAQIRHYRQAVLKYAFEGKLTEEWRRNNPPSVQSGENSEKLGKDEILLSAQNDKGAYNENMPELPEGWRWVRLGEILSPSKERINPLKSEPLPYIGLEHIERDTGKIIGRGLSTTVRSSKNKFYAGDLLYGKLRPYLNKVCVPDFDGVCSTDVLVFSKKTDLSNKYVLYRLLCGDFVRFANQKVSGVQHPRVDFEKIAVFYLPLPPLPEQHQIVEEMERRFSVIEQVEKIVDQSLKQAERLRQSILKRAFEGKLVPQDPNDEPAEKLLERIRQQREQSDKMRTSKRKRRK